MAGTSPAMTTMGRVRVLEDSPALRRNGTGQPCACPGHPRVSYRSPHEVVDARAKPGHDGRWVTSGELNGIDQRIRHQHGIEDADLLLESQALGRADDDVNVLAGVLDAREVIDERLEHDVVGAHANALGRLRLDAE